MMTKAETLAELLTNNRGVKRTISYLESREQRTRGELRRAVRARARHPVPPAEARREARRQAHHLSRQQRAVPRRLLGRHARRHRARAGGARHQRRAQAQAAAHREEAGQALHLHRPQDARSHRRVRGSRRRAGHVRRPAVARLLRRTGRRHFEAPARCMPSSRTTWPSSSSPPGSTSEPKGIVLTHRNILVNARGAGEASRLERERHQPHLDAADPRHGPHRHAHHDVRASHAAATSCRRNCSSAARCCG